MLGNLPRTRLRRRRDVGFVEDTWGARFRLRGPLYWRNVTRLSAGDALWSRLFGGRQRRNRGWTCKSTMNSNVFHMLAAGRFA
jgi:hypothetical protein